MDVNLASDIAALKRLTVLELRLRYAELFGDPTRAGNKPWLVKRIAWRLQALAEGDLSERARRRAAELANDADLRRSPPREAGTRRRRRAPVLPGPATTRCRDVRLPRPGTVLTHSYREQLLRVTDLTEGFEFDGHIYPSLSAVAKLITGAHYNGFLFFRLRRTGGRR